MVAAIKPPWRACCKVASIAMAAGPPCAASIFDASALSRPLANAPDPVAVIAPAVRRPCDSPEPRELRPRRLRPVRLSDLVNS